MKLNPQDLDKIADLPLKYYNQLAKYFWERSMRVIALIEDPGVIRRILDHVRLWVPQAMERSPPLDFASWSTLKRARVEVTMTDA